MQMFPESRIAAIKISIKSILSSMIYNKVVYKKGSRNHPSVVANEFIWPKKVNPKTL